MLPDYEDIIDAAGAPMWWDDHGVPRYAKFDPDMLGVYDKFALFVRIECQSCRTRMLVGCGWPSYSSGYDFDQKPPTFKAIRHSLESLAQGFMYGDPPRHGCGGDSMQSVAIRIEEAWEKGGPLGLRWTRRPDIEQLDVRPEWDTYRA